MDCGYFLGQQFYRVRIIYVLEKTRNNNVCPKHFLARLHEVHRAIVVTSVVPVYVYVYVYVRVTLSVKVFYKSISLDHVDGSS